jgi:hypothetical protein
MTKELSSYPDFADLPVILDFEASSLAAESYPISAGLLVNGKVHYWIIKPKPTWVDWSLPSQAVHGFRRSHLVDHGTDAELVFREIIDLIGNENVYSDNPHWESFWLGILGKHTVVFSNIYDRFPNLAYDRLVMVRDEIYTKWGLIRHRADHDVRKPLMYSQKLLSEP